MLHVCYTVYTIMNTVYLLVTLCIQFYACVLRLYIYYCLYADVHFVMVKGHWKGKMSAFAA